MRSTALLILLTLLATPTLAGNQTLEQRHSEQLDNPALTGKPVWLQAGSLRFLGILEENTAGKHYGAVILLHGAGAHVDWQEVIAPLRHYLAATGWDSLSLQMPVTDAQMQSAGNDTLSDEATPRIRAAVAYFSERKTDHLILIGHGLGARSALAYLSGQPDRAVHALVAIGLAAQTGDAQDPVLNAIGKLNLPMLDLYGSRDLPAVLDSADARRGVARRNRRDGYRQDRVMGANHDFTSLEKSLQLRVGAWLRRLTEERRAGAPSE